MASTKPSKGKPAREDRKALDRVSPDIKISTTPEEIQPSIQDRRPLQQGATLRIDINHPMYRELYSFWQKAGGPAEFMYSSSQWMAINDSGVVFVQKGAVPTGDQMYGDLSMGKGT